MSAAVKRRLRKAKKLLEGESKKRKAFEPNIPSVGSYDFKFPKYLKNRGFTEETLKRWNIRYAKKATLVKEDGKSFTLTHAICIPLFDEKKTLIGWCYRATDKSDFWFRNVRYIYTPGVNEKLNKIWFGMHLHRKSQEIAVVEGALDAIWCDQNGIPAVAILGNQVKQVAKLRRLLDFRKVVLLLDRDFTGAMIAHHIGNGLLERGHASRVCLYPSWMLNRQGERAKDAQDLCGLDLELVYARAIPFVTWKRGFREERPAA